MILLSVIPQTIRMLIANMKTKLLVMLQDHSKTTTSTDSHIDLRILSRYSFSSPKRSKYSMAIAILENLHNSKLSLRGLSTD